MAVHCFSINRDISLALITSKLKKLKIVLPALMLSASGKDGGMTFTTRSARSKTSAGLKASFAPASS